MTPTRPGTISKILWHFTGGPTWDSSKEQYSSERKSERNAFECLTNILKSRELKVGNFREVISVNGKSLATRRVCCVADIPIAHLGFHGDKYGKIAIGFNRSALINARFNPVFYIKEDKPALLRFHEALTSLQSLDIGAEQFMALATGDLRNENEVDQKTRDALVNSLARIKTRVENASKQLTLLLSFFKTLKENDFDSIFCEREWRNDISLKFGYQDVAMIILPKIADDGENYHSNFIKNHAENLVIPREIPIVSWEDLIEH